MNCVADTLHCYSAGACIRGGSIGGGVKSTPEPVGGSVILGKEFKSPWLPLQIQPCIAHVNLCLSGVKGTPHTVRAYIPKGGLALQTGPG